MSPGKTIFDQTKNVRFVTRSTLATEASHLKYLQFISSGSETEFRQLIDHFVKRAISLNYAKNVLKTITRFIQSKDPSWKMPIENKELTNIYSKLFNWKRIFLAQPELISENQELADVVIHLKERASQAFTYDAAKQFLLFIYKGTESWPGLNSLEEDGISISEHTKKKGPMELNILIFGCYFTGARFHEWFYLTRLEGEILSEGGQLKVRSNKTRDKIIDIEAPLAFQPFLRQYLKMVPNTQKRLFGNSRSRMYRLFGLAYEQCFNKKRKAGVAFKFSRNNLAYELLNNDDTKDEKDLISLLFNHTSIKTTNKFYADHVARSTIRENIEKDKTALLNNQCSKFLYDVQI